MDGQIEMSDDDFKVSRYHLEVNKERLERMKKFFCESVGKVFLRNPEFTAKKNDRRVFKIEFAKETMGVLFSTIDDTKYLAESSLYIPFNPEQFNFFNSLVEQTEPIETYRIKYYEKKINELQSSIEELELNSELCKSTLGHFKKKILEEQARLGRPVCI